MRNILTLFITLLSMNCIMAQSPGGVSGSLLSWVTADNGLNCGTEGCTVTDWNSRTGSNHFDKINGNTFLLRFNIINFNPVIEGIGLNRSVRCVSNLAARTVLYTGQTNLSGSSAANNEFMGSNAGEGFRQRLDNVDELISNGTGSSSSNDWTKSSAFHYNGRKITTGNISNTTTFHIGGGFNVSVASNQFFIGGYGGSNYFDASTYYGDVIIYSDALTASEQHRIDTYLAVKYGITLSTDNDNDATTFEAPNADGLNEGDYINTAGTVIWDASNTTDFHNDVIGISRDDDTGLNQKQSRTNDTLVKIYLSTLDTTNALNGGSFSSDEQHVLMGDNTDLLHATAASNAEKPGSVFSRIEREWKVQNTAFTGTFSIDMQLSSSASITLSDLRLLVDTDDDFSNATVYSSADGLTFSESSRNVTISGISTTLIPSSSTRFITLASANSTTTLPIELIDFTGELVQEQVDLYWQTASEINNDYFEIERSKDLKSWKAILNVKGAGNSSANLNYASVDPKPLLGVSYYRLKQVDFDGQFSYSPTIAIVNEHNKQIVIYPNPTSDELVITGKKLAKNKIIILNDLGQTVNSSVVIKSENTNTLKFDVSALSNGIYFVSYKTETIQFIKK